MTTKQLVNGFDKFQESIKSGNSSYFKMKDLPENKPTIIRILPWVFHGEKVEALPHYEGWVDKKSKDSNEIKTFPVRFGLDDTIPELEWSVGTGQYDAGKVKSPSGQIACIIWNSALQKVQLATFSQSSITSKIMGWINPSNEATYMGGELCDVDLILTKKKTQRVEYSLEPKPKSKPLSELPNILSALGEFASSGFSFEEYLKSENPFSGAIPNETGIPVYSDEDRPKSKQAHSEAPTQKQSLGKSENTQGSWRDVKTPSGKLLGEYTLDGLIRIRDSMRETHPLYKSVISGIEALESPEQEEEEIGSFISAEEIPF
jgi:hypothetical protein